MHFGNRMSSALALSVNLCKTRGRDDNVALIIRTAYCRSSVDGSNAQRGESVQFARAACAVAASVDPDTQIGIGRVTCIDDTVSIAVECYQISEAITRNCAEQFGIGDGCAVLRCTNKQTLTSANPTRFNPRAAARIVKVSR